jgi:hypothetical protein
VAAVKPSEDTGGDQACETRGDHVACVEDGHASSDFFLSVEERQEEERARVELRLSGTVQYSLIMD